jgi:hypothetical protein
MGWGASEWVWSQRDHWYLQCQCRQLLYWESGVKRESNYVLGKVEAWRAKCLCHSVRIIRVETGSSYSVVHIREHHIRNRTHSKAIRYN